MIPDSLILWLLEDDVSIRHQAQCDLLNKDDKPLQAAHPGKRHFDMEIPGQPSRWNKVRALRVLEHFRV